MKNLILIFGVLLFAQLSNAGTVRVCGFVSMQNEFSGPRAEIVTRANKPYRISNAAALAARNVADGQEICVTMNETLGTYSNSYQIQSIDGDEAAQTPKKSIFNTQVYED